MIQIASLFRPTGFRPISGTDASEFFKHPCFPPRGKTRARPRFRRSKTRMLIQKLGGASNYRPCGRGIRKNMAKCPRSRNGFVGVLG